MAATFSYTTAIHSCANATGATRDWIGVFARISYARQVIELFRLKFQMAAIPAPMKLAIR